MGIVAAIARVRAGAKSAGLEGALNSLGAELKSDAIPERLRDVAGRLAALIDRNPGANVAHAPVQVASLEVALDQHASLRAAAGPGAACPFTGLRTDEAGVSAPVSQAAPPAEQAHASAPSEAVSTPAEEAPDVSVPAAPAPEAQVAARPASGSAAAERERTSSRAPASSAKRRRAGAEPASREKRKERLAGSSSVANTSGRSATRPAAKRPRSRAEGTRKKS